MEIQSVSARSILDSRGLPTTECKVTTAEGTFCAAVPSGASTGTKEACELRDGGSAYLGKGVQKAVDNLNNVIGPKLVSESKISIVDQKSIDYMLKELDGTANKSKLGANAILAVSQAICRAAAAKKKVPLYQHINDLAKELNKDTQIAIPHMFFNVINGGKHANNHLACQEIMFTVATAKSAEEAVQKASETFHTLKADLKKMNETTNVGDEGGFAPNVTPSKGIELILEAAKKNKYENDVKIGFDFAASEFETEPKSNKYDMDFKRSDLPSEKHQVLSATELQKFYVDLVKQYPQVVSIEDPFSEYDHDSFSSFMKTIRDDKIKCQIVADDLTVTNCDIIKQSIQNKEANALLVKMNQIGSVYEAIEACHLAKKDGWTLMVSHRSGETTDTFVADFAVGVNAESCKFGAPSRGERVAKYNRLMEIALEGKLGMHQHKFY